MLSSLSTSLPQASLAVTILGSAIGTYLALSAPNPSPDSLTLAPFGLLALHTTGLVITHPEIPSFLLRNGAENGPEVSFITWSTATTIPLSLILCAGIPLRLIPCPSLGKNFTFALPLPDRLETNGFYRYMQHPSYTGLVVLVLSNIALLCRIDGAVSCWIPPSWGGYILVWLFGVWTRVRQEERMLRANFGVNWEEWHSKTPRFLPWRF
ncbi:hypothetical protein B0J15DRAFT_574189 [Fusarium solani]|uniref:Protein-S-isoprenylcysteine O-methyltransferase n=1 Tax=Fusarium solani TaxID=169388 RepID=A0A9P9L3E2_FUSSL|nr:uncharacterized protein B0J15DRAFT_574189 [Fusarium solani]KAH7273251.1 hypothetical protein B0J15DRAFT_574189 [Fusarium solani]